jgi:hypothetical protein
MKKFDKMMQSVLMEYKNLTETFKTFGNIGVCLRNFIICTKNTHKYDGTHFLFTINSNVETGYPQLWAGTANMFISCCDSHDQTLESEYDETNVSINSFYTKVLQTKDQSQVMHHLKQNINEMNSKYFEEDADFKDFLYRKFQHTLNLFVESHFVEKYTEFITYNLYHGDGNTLLLTVSIMLLSSLDSAKNMTQDAEDDISNW